MTRQRQDWLRIAGAERPGPRHRGNGLEICRTGRQGPIDQERIRLPRRRHDSAEPVFEIGKKGRQRLAPERHAGRHGVPPALEQKPVADGLPHRAAEIGARDGAARSGADAARPERNREGRAAEPLLEPRGDEADHARMPTLRGRDHDSAALFQAQRRHGLRLGLHQRRNLDDLTLAIEPVELGGQTPGLDRILFQQEVHPKAGATDAASRIDARPQQEAEVPGLRRPAQARNIHQGSEPRIVAPAQRQESLGHKGAVEPPERNHVGHGAERH